MDRLRELWTAAGLSVPPAEPKVIEEKAGSLWEEAWFKTVAADEEFRAVCLDIKAKVGVLKEVAEDAQGALLPAKVQQLASKFEFEEAACVRLINRAKALVGALRQGASSTGSTSSSEALEEIRSNLAERGGAEFKALVKEYFNARHRYRDEVQSRARRQLLLAFPNATDEDLQEALLSTTIANAAIARKVELGANCPSLSEVLAELEAKDGRLQMLADGSQDLKVLFLQFAELLDQQDESLGEIEANIQSTLKQTEDAVDVLREAADLKAQFQRMQCRIFTGVAIVLLLLFFWFFGIPGFHHKSSLLAIYQSPQPPQALVEAAGTKATKADLAAAAHSPQGTQTGASLSSFVARSQRRGRQWHLRGES